MRLVTSWLKSACTRAMRGPLPGRMAGASLTCGDRLRRQGHRPTVDGGADLQPEEIDQVVGVEAEVEAVVAQEAAGVDGPRQVAVLAVLEGGQVADPDLGVALDTRQVDEPGLASGPQHFAELGRLALRHSPSSSRNVSVISP